MFCQITCSIYFARALSTQTMLSYKRTFSGTRFLIDWPWSFNWHLDPFFFKQMAQRWLIKILFPFLACFIFKLGRQSFLLLIVFISKLHSRKCYGLKVSTKGTLSTIETTPFAFERYLWTVCVLLSPTFFIIAFV